MTAMNDEELSRAIDDLRNEIQNICGLSPMSLGDDKQGNKTATAIEAMRNKLAGRG